MHTDRWRKATPKIWFVLGRTITWTEDSYTWEPDEKHAQILIRTLGLEQCNPSATPYYQESKDMLQEDDHELSEHEIRAHRGNVARVVYLAQDRMDLSVSACLLATSMANPRGSDQARLKRVAGISKAAPCSVSCIPGNPKRPRSLCRRTAIGRRARTPDDRKVGALFSSAFNRFRIGVGSKRKWHFHQVKLICTTAYME